MTLGIYLVTREMVQPGPAVSRQYIRGFDQAGDPLWTINIQDAWSCEFVEVAEASKMCANNSQYDPGGWSVVDLGTLQEAP